VLITGASGFIGTNLLQDCLNRGWPALNFDCRAPRNPEHLQYWFRGDLLVPGMIRKAICEHRPDVLFHLAARTDLAGRALSGYAANVEGVANLIDALARCSNPPERVLFASSVFVFQRGYQPRHETDYCPFTVYGESKMVGERLVRAASLPCSWVIVRPTSIWGPWFGVPFLPFFRAIERGRYIHPRGVRIGRTLGFVGNSVDQLQALAGARRQFVDMRSFFIGDPPIELGDWADVVASALGRPRPHRMPIALMRTLALSGDIAQLLGIQSPPLTTFRLHNMLTPGTNDISSTLEIAGPARFTPAEGARQTAAWLASECTTPR